MINGFRYSSKQIEWGRPCSLLMKMNYKIIFPQTCRVSFFVLHCIENFKTNNNFNAKSSHIWQNNNTQSFVL